MDRPPFILSTHDVPSHVHRYPGSDEAQGISRPIGKAAGLLRIGLHVEEVLPGRRISFPHAESNEEEFVFVLDGEVDAWIDGHLHAMKAGDLAAFPAGTGICHTILNNGDRPATLLVGGEASKQDNKIYYPLHAHRRGEVAWSQWWDDIPLRPQGPHDAVPVAKGKPAAKRAAAKPAKAGKPAKPAKAKKPAKAGKR